MTLKGQTMNLIKITDLTTKLGISSRSLRYYEQTGLIKSIRTPTEKYRHYDTANIERLKQIIILRKMLIPIKDIIRIYESNDTSIVVETFVNRIQAIDEEVSALTELRRIVNEFLQTMKQKGVTKISALPILYEGMEKQLVREASPLLSTVSKPVACSGCGRDKPLLLSSKPAACSGCGWDKPLLLSSKPDYPTGLDELSALSQRLTGPINPAIIYLPPMQTLTSYLKADPQTTDAEGFISWTQANNISTGAPGTHTQLEYQTATGDVIILRVNDDYVNDSPYLTQPFPGGLFAAVNVYLDDDISETFRTLISSFDENKYYEIDYTHNGDLRHEALLENLISPDDKRDLVSLMVPVKKRLPDPALFHKPDMLSSNTISIEEIEKQNPTAWEAEIPLDKLIPINNPHYKVVTVKNRPGEAETTSTEAEYVGWISTRVLATQVEVKLPFRVDIEFRVDTGTSNLKYGYDGGKSLRIYHGHHSKDHSYAFGINMGGNADPALSKEALSFHQPVFRDYYEYPGQGKIKSGDLNRLTWIVGPKHLACIINGEVRYCGTSFPYMSLDLSREIARPIVLGSDGNVMKYFRKIKISQLAWLPKNKIKEGALIMATKQSNNIIPNIHRVITDEYGENYWFNGCAKYVMESLGEPDYDYNFFAGLTGDVFTQSYPLDQKFRSDGVSGYNLEENPEPFVEALFEKCGYAVTYISGKDLRKNTEMYMQALIGYIDKGVPVIAWCIGNAICGVLVGYEEHGKTLLYVEGNKNEPKRVPLEDAIKDWEGNAGGWIFVGEKKQTRELSQIYREAIQALPALMTQKTHNYSFGPEAFRAWANEIETGRYDNIKPEEFNGWTMHNAYICALATNGSCCHEFLIRAQKLNPDMGYLDEISKLYSKTAAMWNKQNGEDLEALGGGFNVTLEALQDREKRTKIAMKIREIAGVVDEIVQQLEKNQR